MTHPQAVTPELLAVIQADREAAAKVADEMILYSGQDIANAIRALPLTKEPRDDR